MGIALSVSKIRVMVLKLEVHFSIENEWSRNKRCTHSLHVFSCVLRYHMQILTQTISGL